MGLTAIFLWFLFNLLFPSEPAYQGKTVTQWAGQYGTNHWRRGTREAAQEAETAIRQIGTRATPILLKHMWVKESALKKKLRSVAPRGLWITLHIDDTSIDRRRMGAAGLVALGTNATPVLPELIQIATHHPEEDARYIAVFTIRNLGPVAAPAVPFLIQCLTNQAASIRENAALALGVVGLYPDQVVPALLQYLQTAKDSPHWRECTSAIYALSRFGTNSQPAVPSLVNLLSHSNPEIREAVTNYLPLIAPGIP